MPIKNQASTRFTDELRIISPWAFFLSVLGFIAGLVGVIAATLADKNPPPLAAMVLVGILGGVVLACYILIIGYVNADACRRGMSRLLWTLLAILIPNALGIVLYFILRKPLSTVCPQCGAMLEPGFGFCPRCRYRLTPVCPACQRSVRDEDKYCPYCGTDLAAGIKEAATGTQPATLPR